MGREASHAKHQQALQKFSTFMENALKEKGGDISGEMVIASDEGEEKAIISFSERKITNDVDIAGSWEDNECLLNKVHIFHIKKSLS